MREISKAELAKVLLLHQLYLDGDGEGERADLRYVDLTHANLAYANLSEANMANCILTEANLMYAKLLYTDLSAAKLQYAELSSANLQYADLRYSDISESNLSHANLSHANLRFTDLSESNLSHANLSDAILGTANLQYSNLSEAILTDAIARLDFGGWSICVRHDVTTIGCKTFLNSEWLKWSPEDVSDFGDEAAEWWQTHGEAVKAVIRCVQAKHEKLGFANDQNSDLSEHII